MSWSAAVLVMALLATVICTGHAVQLHRAGDPGWKLPGAMALMCVASMLTQGDLVLLTVVALGVTAIAVYLAWSYRRERGGAPQDREAP